ncbi:MAG: DUF932 domain-containing protein [Planctomycetes bacterium]|nr:DUF932 domain-containing protein [Planctomycetota bacterium]
MPGYVESMFYTGQTPWHGIGVALESPPTALEAIRAAGLNWRVEKQPIFTPHRGTDDLKEIPGFSAVVRRDKRRVLGIVGKNWQPLQNRDAFKFFDPFIESKVADYHTAGSLKEGQQVWVLAKLRADPMTVVKGDEVEKYLLLSNSHDGKAAVSVRFSPVRVVCWNTLGMAESDDASPFLRIRHAGNLRQTMQRVQEVVDITNRTFEATLEQYRWLAKRQVGNVHKFVLDVLQVPDDAEKPPRALSNIIELFENGRGQDNKLVRGTMWAAYNSITEWVDHERGRDGTRLHSAFYGEGRRIKQRALTVATEMARAA